MSRGQPPLNRLSAPVARLEPISDEGKSREGRDSPRLGHHATKSTDLTRESLRAYLEKRSPTTLERSSVGRANQELARRADYPLNCSISLTIKDVESGNSVYYKYDGQRFQHSDATIKIFSGAVYEFSLVLKPSIEIAPNVLHLRSTCGGDVRQSLVFLEKSRVDGKSLVGNWKCELAPSKKSDRVEVALSGRLAHFGEFNVPLLTKVYAPNQKGAWQGFKLRLVVFEIQRTEGEQQGLVQLDSVRYMS